jgi:hypothetical protein
MHPTDANTILTKEGGERYPELTQRAISLQQSSLFLNTSPVATCLTTGLANNFGESMQSQTIMLCVMGESQHPPQVAPEGLQPPA